MGKKSKVAAIIVAAGSGKRMGSAMPKQFIEIDGKEILRYTCERMQSFEEIDEIYVILSSQDVEKYKTVLSSNWNLSKLARIVEGGEHRHLSVWAGIKSLAKDVDIVMIHDGVRPFITHQIVVESIKAAEKVGAAVVGLIPKDTIKKTAHGMSVLTLERKALFIAQTPQTFRKEIIIRANEKAFINNNFNTDDAALVEQIDGKVALVKGDWRNIKITTPEDLIIAEAFIKQEKQNENWTWI